MLPTSAIKGAEHPVRGETSPPCNSLQTSKHSNDSIHNSHFQDPLSTMHGDSCPNCNAVIDSGTKTCASCGAVSPTAVREPQLTPLRAARTSLLFKPSCHLLVEEGAGFKPAASLI